jgi:hypothetical protein
MKGLVKPMHNILKKLIAIFTVISIFTANLTIFNNINVSADDNVIIFDLDDPDIRDLFYALNHDDAELFQQVVARPGMGLRAVFVVDRPCLLHFGLPVRKGQQQEYLTPTSLAVLFKAPDCLNLCLGQGGDHPFDYQRPNQMSPAECAAFIGDRDLMIDLNARWNFPYYKLLLFAAIDGMDVANPNADACAEIVRWIIRDRNYPLYSLSLPAIEELARHIANLRWRDFRALTDLFDQGQANERLGYNLGDLIAYFIQHAAPPQTIIFFLDEFPGLPTWTDDRGWTLLHFAAQAQNFEVIRYLVGLGMDVNARTFAGQTPLKLVRVDKATFEKNPSARHRQNKCKVFLRAHGARWKAGTLKKPKFFKTGQKYIKKKGRGKI